MTNKDIVRALSETADLIELTGGNRYRANAFNRAARALKGLDTAIDEALDDGTLTDIDGIGSGMADHIADLVQTGSFELRDELQSAVPPGLLDVLRVKGLGTKRARTLWRELDVTSLDELEQAALADRITSLSGFGTKTQEKILKNVRLLRRYNAQRRYADARSDLQPLLDALRAEPGIDRAELAGPVRRRLETVEEADLLVAGAAEAVETVLAEHLDDASAGEVSLSDADLDTDEAALRPAVSGSLPSGLSVTVTRTTPDRFGTDWWLRTGSTEHVAAVRDHASGSGNGTLLDDPVADEAALYEAAGLPAIPPELREGRGEVDAAAAGALPSLLKTGELRGSLHNHSTYSDGAHSLRDMAETARDMGLSYFGICDHSQSLQVADGMKPDEVEEQQAEIRTLNEEFATRDRPFRIFSGIESDILKDGSLDYEEDVLESFDFVVASVHTGFNMTEAEATERVVRAVENPHTRILGHPTGRLLLVREGYPLDHERVIDACAEHDVAIELNANPYRLDLDWRYIRRATEAGVLISINPDAHATGELEYVRWGVAVARKGWLTAANCLNAKSLTEFTEWIDSPSA
jgi:DNA polymerase (family 10)